MNTFAAFADSDDESPVVKAQVKKEATAAAAKAKTAPKATGGADANEAGKVNPRSRGAAGGKAKNKERTAGRVVKPKSGEPRQRQFDRRSGTGRGKELQKDGVAGWGNSGKEARDAEKNGVADEAAQGAADADNELANETAELDLTPKEPAKPTFTYEEFMAKKSGGATNVFATLGESNVGGPRKETMGIFMKLGQDKKKREKGSQRSGEKVMAAPGFLLAKPESSFEDRPPRFDRGDREGGRGGGRRDRDAGRGAGRSAPRAAAGSRPVARNVRGPAIDNEADFPSL